MQERDAIQMEDQVELKWDAREGCDPFGGSRRVEMGRKRGMRPKWRIRLS